VISRLSLCILVVFALFPPFGPRGVENRTLAPGGSSSALTITADGTTLLVVNPDSNSLTLVDMASKQVLAEIPVGVDPRTVAVNDASQRAYVANRGSSSISVVDLARRQAVAEVDIGYRPYGVVIHPDGSRLYVAVQGEDRIVTLDTTTFEIVNSHPTVDRPSGLALSHDGDTLYVTHLLTGTLTVLHPTSSILFLPLILKGSPSGSTSIPNPQSPIRDPRSPISDIQLWPDSNLVQSVVLSPDGRTAYVPHTRSNSGNPYLTFDTTVFPLVSLIDGEEAVHLVEQLHRNTVILDMQMPHMDGLEAIRQIKRSWPEVRVVALTLHAGYRTEACAAGADLFLLKGCSVEEIWASVAVTMEPKPANRRPSI